MSPELANHLLQSTIFAVAAGLLTLLLRNNHARARYWIWLTASLKFLIPFSLFVELGHRLSYSTAPAISHPQLTLVIDEVSQPFEASPVPIHIAATSLPILPAIWISGSALLLIFWLIRWYRVTTLLRTSGAQLEPGVFGILRPVLYLPAGIEDHLDDAQLKAIVAHEHCHIRNRDNLTAALHSLVEAIFWFHPLTWWIGARLVEERERACDEEVVMRGSDPEIYAESILKICKLYLESPLTCVPGITGSDLKKRIEAIMTNRALRSLNPAKKIALAVACLIALVVPILVGIVHAQSATPKFEAASIKLLNMTPLEAFQAGHLDWHIDDALVDMQGTSLLSCMRYAYNVPENQIANAPEWMSSTLFDIRAKLPQGGSKDQVRAMLQSLLSDRFKLAIHHQTEIRPAYELTAGNKLNLTLSNAPNPGPASPCKEDSGHNVCKGMTMGELATLLSVLGERGAMWAARGTDADWLIDRPVVDMTHLSGPFDFTLDYGHFPNGGIVRLKDSVDALGLRLQPSKHPFDIIAIDHIERTPTEN